MARTDLFQWRLLALCIPAGRTGVGLAGPAGLAACGIAPHGRQAGLQCIWLQCKCAAKVAVLGRWGPPCDASVLVAVVQWGIHYHCCCKGLSCLGTWVEAGIGRGRKALQSREGEVGQGGPVPLLCIRVQPAIGFQGGRWWVSLWREGSKLSKPMPIAEVPQHTVSGVFCNWDCSGGLSVGYFCFLVPRSNEQHDTYGARFWTAKLAPGQCLSSSTLHGPGVKTGGDCITVMTCETMGNTWVRGAISQGTRFNMGVDVLALVATALGQYIGLANSGAALGCCFAFHMVVPCRCSVVTGALM